MDFEADAMAESMNEIFAKFMFFEMIVGVVQATVFSILTLVYLTIATTGHDTHEASHEHHEQHA